MSAETKETFIWGFRLVLLCFMGLISYGVLYGNAQIWYTRAEGDALKGRVRDIEPQVRSLQVHAADPHIHLGFNERAMLPTRDDIQELKEEIRRLNDRLDRTPRPN